MDPKEYRKHIHMLGIGDLKNMKISAQSDAEKVLSRVLEMQQGLVQITQEVDLDIKFNKEQKKSKKKSGGFSLFKKKKESPEEESGTIQDLDAYENLKKDIDTLESQLDRLQTQLESYIKERRSAPESEPAQPPAESEEDSVELPPEDSLFETYLQRNKEPEEEKVQKNEELDEGKGEEPSEINLRKEKFCPYCGNILNASDVFCGKCGKKL
jgi:hypothetical protein